MTQTGSVPRVQLCGLYRKAVAEAGYPQIPVVALSAQGIEVRPVSISLKGLHKAVISLLYGDLIVRVSMKPAV